MLNEQTLFGERNKVEIALARVREFEPMALQNSPAGYYVCISGGKDSSVIQELCIMAGIRCEFVHNHTSVDHPETVYFVRREKERMEALGYTFRIEVPRYRDGRQKTMWNGIVVNGLPLRNQRWCCRDIKETSGHNRYCVTGVRWAESGRRAQSRNVHEITGKNKREHIVFYNDNDMRRRLSEMCLAKRRFVLNPIVDWSDQDVWDFIKSRHIPVNPLYKKGWKRIGCIGCPMSRNGRKELDRLPQYKAAYFRAAKRHIEHRREKGLPEKGIMETAEKYFEWWMSGESDDPELTEPEIIFEEEA
jgi:phosphoadenosine phosphosulfate reductase